MIANKQEATNSNPVGANVASSELDQMAELLVDQFDDIENADVEADTAQNKQQEQSSEDSSSEEQEQSSEEQLSDQEENLTWSKALGVDDKNVVLDENGDFIAIKVNVLGKEFDVKIPDLIAGYQTNKANTQKSQALAEEVKQFSALKEATVQAYTQKLESVNKLTNYLEQSFLREFQGIDWDNLRTQNPGEYAATVQDFNIRKTELQKIYIALEQERQTELQTVAEAQQKQIKERLDIEISKALEKNPTWSDPAVFKKDVEELKDFVGEAYGFTPEEFETIHDHRLLELVKDAMRYRKNTQAAAQKLLKPVPKFQNAQSRNLKPASKLDKLVKAAKNSSGYRKVEAQTDAIAELLQNL